MNVIERLRQASATRAVVWPDDEPEEERHLLRVLPSPGVGWALMVTILVIAGIGVWRLVGGASGASLPSHPQPSAISQPASPSSQVASQSGQGGAAPLASPAPTSGPAASTPLGAAHHNTQPPAQSGTPHPGSSQATNQMVTVHIAGAVAKPGVVTVPVGSRVYEAVNRAGGPAEQADMSAVNLARVLVDGEQIVIPLQGQTPPPTQTSPQAESPAGSSPGPAQPGSSNAGQAQGCIDLVTADITQLQELDGVGPALAKRIVAHRDSGGSVATLADLDAVSGIGPALLERIGATSCQK
ncbi:MAG: helix-hairpin-helix domain-containing protein [Actinomycetaceae bacterium]|nr:helix-hairpin-helix domain-containing protein [Actinomycetaceae bacterium]